MHGPSAGLAIFLLATGAAPRLLAEPSADEVHPRWFVLPNAAYDSDDGLGFGVRAELILDEPGLHPFHSAFVVHAFATDRGYHHHRFRYERAGLGPGGRLRMSLHLAWRQWLNDGYYGLGNGSLREESYTGDFGDGDPRRKRYRYQLYQPFLHATVRYAFQDGWSLHAALTLKHSTVRTYQGSLLEEERPHGLEGGLGLQISGGVLFDSRNPELSPRAGVFAELIGRFAPPLPDGDGGFAGLFASLRAFHGLWPSVVLASRLMGEVMLGDVPFYELVHWGGSAPITGFGGFETIRGLAFGRFRGPGKLVANAELRIDVLHHDLFGRPMTWQLVPWADVGFVFGAGEADRVAPGALPVHPGAGGGLRAVFDGAFVGRVDGGAAFDPVARADGGVENEATLGVYVVFDHTF